MELCRDLCMGISRLEDLPGKAFSDLACPLKITPRTPTETYFWVEKPLERFSLGAQSPIKTKGLETLHTHLVLKYEYADGLTEELLIGADLFHVLLELEDGFQLADAASGDLFANLDIFTQRLAQENSREMFAWNPMKDQSIFKLSINVDGGVQQMRLAPIRVYEG